MIKAAFKLDLKPSNCRTTNVIGTGKILFALRADEFLVMLESKIREALFFNVQSVKIIV